MIILDYWSWCLGLNVNSVCVLCVYVSQRWPWGRLRQFCRNKRRRSDRQHWTLCVSLCVWVYAHVFLLVCVHLFCVYVLVHPPCRFVYLPAARYLRINPSVRTRNWQAFTTVWHTHAHTPIVYPFLGGRGRVEKEKWNNVVWWCCPFVSYYNKLPMAVFSFPVCVWVFRQTLRQMFCFIVTYFVPCFCTNCVHICVPLYVCVWQLLLINNCSSWEVLKWVCYFPPDCSPFSFCLSTFLKCSHTALGMSILLLLKWGHVQLRPLQCLFVSCFITHHHTDGHNGSPYLKCMCLLPCLSFF